MSVRYLVYVTDCGCSVVLVGSEDKLLKSKCAYKLLVFIVSSVLFFALTLVARQYFNILSVAGIRPSALPPVLGLLFGPYAVLGCALGNLAADIISGYSLLMNVLGFVAQFIYGITPYLMWKAFDEYRNKTIKPVNFSNAGNVVRYISIILLNALIATTFVGSIIRHLGADSFFSTQTLMLLLNNIVFCIVIGIPLIIFVSAVKSGLKGLSLSMNERLVLIFLFAGIVSGGLIGIMVVRELSYAVVDPVTMWMNIYMYIVANLIAFYVITIAFLIYCEKKITLPIEIITGIAKNYVDGEGKRSESGKVVKECDLLVGTKGEAGILAAAFKTMVLDIDAYITNLKKITTENERISTELNIARQMQEDMLPNIFPAFPERHEFEIHAIMHPAKEIGGDFYDFFMIDDDHLGIVIADVSGKGIPAALFMVITKTLISNWTRHKYCPSEVFSKVNSQLCEGNESAMFVTAWMGILKISTGELTYSNAGHDPPQIMKDNTSLSQIPSVKNLMLGAMDGVKYKESKSKMQKGERLFLYTDGATEAINPSGEQFGLNRLLTSFGRFSDRKPEEALFKIKADIDLFADEEPQFDDITMLMLLIK